MIAQKIFFLLVLIFPFASLGQSGNQIIEYKTEIEVDKKKLVTKKSFLIQVNDKQSDWITDVEIHYNKNDKLDILEAAIVDLKGDVIRKLKKKEIITRSSVSSGTFYQDDLIKEFKLKWNRYPYRIKYSYTITTENFIHITRWIPTRYTNVPTLKASLKVDLPADYNVKVEHSEGLDLKTSSDEKITTYYCEATGFLPIQTETFSPPFLEIVPSVTIVPEKFHYGIEGSCESWASFGNWHHKLNEGLLELPQQEKFRINELTAGITDKNELIKIVYRYLQESTRYINVAIDIGGLKPYPASYVSKNKYGDCKALTIYMKALLNYLNIPSYYIAVFRYKPCQD